MFGIAVAVFPVNCHWREVLMTFLIFTNIDIPPCWLTLIALCYAHMIDIRGIYSFFLSVDVDMGDGCFKPFDNEC